MEPHVLDVRTADLAELRALPHDELTEALYQLSPSELAALFTRLGDEALVELLEPAVREPSAR